MIPDEHGKSIEWEDIDDADELMAKLKKAGFSFKVDMREAVKEGGPGSGPQAKSDAPKKKKPTYLPPIKYGVAKRSNTRTGFK